MLCFSKKNDDRASACARLGLTAGAALADGAAAADATADSMNAYNNGAFYGLHAAGQAAGGAWYMVGGVGAVWRPRWQVNVGSTPLWRSVASEVVFESFSGIRWASV
jgi:hypothetical protein